MGNTAHIVGHLTGIAASRMLSLDVTDFVRDHPDQEVTFLIAREVRYDGENVDDDLTSLRLASKERGTDPGPQLLLTLSDFALPGDYDHSGTVDPADYTAWRQSFGTASLVADGNRDGIVDAADYTVWRDNLGTSLPGSAASELSAAAAAAAPEPCAPALALMGAFCVLSRTGHICHTWAVPSCRNDCENADLELPVQLGIEAKSARCSTHEEL